jgi:hypothetical protein
MNQNDFEVFLLTRLFIPLQLEILASHPLHLIGHRSEPELRLSRNYLDCQKHQLKTDETFRLSAREPSGAEFKGAIAFPQNENGTE